MKSLFAGPAFSDVMNKHLQKMCGKIEETKGFELIGRTDEELLALAEKYAEDYQANDVPALQLQSIQKVTLSETGTLCWEIPFDGNKAYFNFRASISIPGQYALAVENDCIRLQVEPNRHNGSMERAEAVVEKRLSQIVQSLEQIQHDVDMRFSKESIQETALYFLKKRREQCTNTVLRSYVLR